MEERCRCNQEEIIKEHTRLIETLRIDVAVAKSDIKSVKDDIKDIKSALDKLELKIESSVSKLIYWILGIGGSIVVSAIGIIVALLSKGG